MNGDGFVMGMWQRLRRRWHVCAALFAVVFALGAALILLARPIHRTEAKLRLGEAPPMGGVGAGAGSMLGLLRLGGDAFANDLELLASRTLAEGVVDDATLNVKLIAPRGWHRDSLVTVLRADRSTRRATYTAAWLADGRITVRNDTATSDAITTRAGDVITFAGVTIAFRPWRTGMPREIAIKTLPHAEAVRVTGGQIMLERTRRDANVVRIRFEHPDPAVTLQVVNSAVSRFTALRTAIQRRESGETVDSLRTIAAHTAAELARTEDEIEALQRTTGFVMPEAQGEAVIERYATVGAQLEMGRIELAALDSALRRAQASDAAGAWTALLAYPRFLENATLGELLARWMELEQARVQLAQRRGAENVEYRTLVEQIDFLDRSLRTLATDYRGALVQQLSALERQTGEMEALLAGVPRNAIDLARKQRQARILAEVTVLTEQRLRQEELRQALTFSNVQVIDPPALRDRPVWPRKKLGLAVVFMFAFGTSVLGLVVSERADTTVRNATQVRSLLDAPVLAVLRLDAPAPRSVSVVEAAAILRRGVVETPGHVRVALAAVHGDRALAQTAADAIIAGAVLPDGDNAVPLAAPDLVVLPGIDNFAAASAAAAERVPLIVVVHAAVTSEAAVQRANALLREAGVTVVGAIVVCRNGRDAEAVWA
jgi:uncharacterized protein involved in exopolysaccharide biosynthesis